MGTPNTTGNSGTIGALHEVIDQLEEVLKALEQSRRDLNYLALFDLADVSDEVTEEHVHHIATQNKSALELVSNDLERLQLYLKRNWLG